VLDWHRRTPTYLSRKVNWCNLETLPHRPVELTHRRPVPQDASITNEPARTVCDPRTRGSSMTQGVHEPAWRRGGLVAAVAVGAADRDAGDRVLSSSSPSERTRRSSHSTKGLSEAGYVEGQNVGIRWAERQYHGFSELQRNCKPPSRSAALASGPGLFAAMQSVEPSVDVEVSPVNVGDTAEPWRLFPSELL
jgi:hypothetical protein